ncbi:glycosyltransferase [Vreelandella neptunia]|uniref:Glycosyltransferase n=1 Tax=Vreelandella neptunia TaxID=115551 RepID=A0ABS9S1Q8_9GAMM|nr:glycosyltransferase [Halomonas neptunia]MCH4810009.1 glycosyltransferase [Halomonas neptunia]
MHIVIDMQGAQAENRRRGIGRYSVALAKELSKQAIRENHKVSIVLNGTFQDSIEKIKSLFSSIISYNNVFVWQPAVPCAHIHVENNWSRVNSEKLYEAFLKTLNPDVVLITSLFEGLSQNAITSIGKFCDLPTAVVLYDLIPYIHSSPYLDNPSVENWYREKIDFLKKSDHLLAISESSRQEAIKYLGYSNERVSNISTDADPEFSIKKYTNEDKEELLSRYGITKKIVLYTGGIDYRKNIENLIISYSNLPDVILSQHQMAIVCAISPNDRLRLQTIANDHGLSKDAIILTDFVPEDDLIALYNLCTLFVFPSWHEGFGLPVLEAMRCGAAVIGANTSSIPEVIGLEEALFDPKDNDSITIKIQQALTDVNFQKRLQIHAEKQAKNFSWHKTAKASLEAIEKNFGSLNLVTDSKHFIKKPKMAYMSPLPPERSGISDYSADLLPELSKYYDIDVVVQQDYISTEWIVNNCKVVTPNDFLNSHNLYDRVVYHFGNSEFHAYMLPLIEKVPGIVVMHDFFLSGLMAYNGGYANLPFFYIQTLYSSHGYAAVKAYFESDDTGWIYPCNKDVISNSNGVIFHSPFSLKLTKEWYGDFSTDKSQVIPLLRVSADVSDQRKISAKLELGFAKDDFLICSFGMIGKPKLNDLLIKAWENSLFSKNKNCFLVFVGQNEPAEYGLWINELIKNSPFAENIIITGWLSEQDFSKYLLAADIGVQLRGLTRGETSAAVLDCMNYGLPTIVNANGSMADLDDDAVLKISDKFESIELETALDTLYKNSELRASLSSKARQKVLLDHSPSVCGQSYYQAVENFYSYSASVHQIIDSLDNDYPFDTNHLRSFASAIDRSIPKFYEQKQILVDISELVNRDSKSGIQRVVKNVLKEWLVKPPSGYRVEPIYAMPDKTGFFYARNFTLGFLEYATHLLEDEPISYRAGDVFVGLDLNFEVAQAQQNFIRNMRNSGVYVSYIVYDLLPIKFPEFWPPQSNVKKIYQSWLEVVTSYDSAVCISQSVASELKEWMNEHSVHRETPLKISWFHLGSDLENSAPSMGLPENADSVITKLTKHPSFLMVGTLEPRKGYAEVLTAFENLWKKGEKVNLVIVGKKGWLVDKLINKINSHPKLNKHLFWMEGVSDEYLNKIYKNSNCLIAASYGEGFGLPLIEAANHGVPVIARDIPVFREVSESNTLFFSDEKPYNLLNVLHDFLAYPTAAIEISSSQKSRLSWEESADNLLNALTVERNMNE